MAKGQWDYAWVAPKEVGQKSNFKFTSSGAAIDDAIRHARIGRKKKIPLLLPLEPKQKKLVWRSMRKIGWRIRWRKKRNESGTD